MLSNLKINNSIIISRLDIESGDVYLRSPKQARLHRATMLFSQHGVGKPKFCLPLCAPTQPPSLPYLCKKTLIYIHVHGYVPEPVRCLDIRDHLKKTFPHSLCPFWRTCLFETAVLSPAGFRYEVQVYIL